jgi:hypothetical protein
MSKKKTVGLELDNLVEGQVIWSEFFKRYMAFCEYCESEGYVFKNIDKDGYTVLRKSLILDPPSLIKELL